MANSQIEVLGMLNGTFAMQPFLLQWQNVYYRTSIHTTGTCPRFYPLRYDEFSGYALDTTLTTPAWWISANYDIIFETHLLNRYPREPQITREWRKSVYRPYQTAPLLEAINSLQACIFGENKYTLSVDDKADNEYINGKNFEGKTFMEYFQWMFKAICEDPNSLFVVVPKYSRKETGEMVEPTIKHIPSAEILWINDEEVVYYEPYTNRNFAWWVTEMGYFRFRKSDDGRTYEAVDGTDDGYYAHLLHRKPIYFAGGLWNTLRYYDSYLKAALPYCDDFVSAHSDVQMINKEACFPFIQMVQQDCPHCNGLKEVNYCSTCHSKATLCRCNDDIADIGIQMCPDCNGQGHIISFNPGQRILVPKEEADKELMKIINFDVNINKYMAEYAESIKNGIKKALYQEYVDEAQSGVAKKIDREPAYLYRETVSNGVWNLMENCLRDILSLRHTIVEGDDRVPDMPKYDLVKPTDFALKTEMDLLEEYTESGTAKMPDYVRARQLQQYVDKTFGGSDIMKKKTAIINEMDPYSVTPNVDKAAMLSSGGISIDTYTFSNNLPTIIDKVIREKTAQWFINATYDQIDVEVQRIFAPMKEPKPTADETIVKINE